MYSNMPFIFFYCQALAANDQYAAPQWQARADPYFGGSLQASDFASPSDTAECIEAFKVLASLDLRCLDNLQMVKVVESAMEGKVNLAQLYQSCVEGILVESGLSRRNLEAIGLPLAVPNFVALPFGLACNYINMIYPDGKRHAGMTSNEEQECILTSILHVALTQEPSQENMRMVLKKMPTAYLLKSWMATKSGLASKASADIFMFFQGSEVCTQGWVVIKEQEC